eukprot:6204409-Pleurochrysis_carterae.AAC.4
MKSSYRAAAALCMKAYPLNTRVYNKERAELLMEESETAQHFVSCATASATASESIVDRPQCTKYS